MDTKIWSYSGAYLKGVPGQMRIGADASMPRDGRSGAIELMFLAE